MKVKLPRQFKKDEALTSWDLDYGNQDEMDLISYDSLQEKNDHIQIDGRFYRCLFVSGYPYTATSGWLNNLINFNNDIDVSYHITKISALSSLPKLNRKITELESTKRSLIKAGRIIGPEITDPLNSAMALRDKIQRGQEMLFQIGIYICLNCSSLDELDKTTINLESGLSANLFFTKTARFQQIEAMSAVLPRSEDKLNQRRNLDSSSMALTFPFISSQLVQEQGVLYGINKSNSSLVIVDRFSLNNANSITFAQSGSGKSYTTKVEILRQLITGTSVIVIDPEREYRLLCESLKGSYIKLALNSKQSINPFDFDSSSTVKRDLSEHIQDLTEIISLMVDGLLPAEKTILDKSLISLYEKNNNRKPVLKDLYYELLLCEADELASRLERFINGSLSHVFSNQSNVSLNNRLVVFDIKDMPDSLRQLMVLIISTFVQNEVKLNPKKRLLVIDEGWLLLQHQESARFIAGLVRRARKYYLGVSIISQQANDFLSDDYGRAIASQSSLRILMRQDSTTIKKVVSHFNLSEFEKNLLLTSNKGEALIIADNNHVALKVIASKDEHPLITTNPAEIYDL